MPNVREVLDKVSELRSRYAILHELVTFLDTHCKTADGGGAELKIQRDDHAFVPEEHIDSQMALLVHEMELIQRELEEWENLSVTEEEEKKPAKKKTGGGKRKRAPSRQRKDQSAASEDPGSGNGSTPQ